MAGYREEYREAKTSQNRPKTPANAIKTQVIHTTRQVKLILLFFPVILNYSVRSLYSHTNSYNNAVTQCHVDGSKGAWDTCAVMIASVA